MPKFMFVALTLFVVSIGTLALLWNSNWFVIVKLILSVVPIFLAIVGGAIVYDGDEWSRW